MDMDRAAVAAVLVLAVGGTVVALGVPPRTIAEYAAAVNFGTQLAGAALAAVAAAALAGQWLRGAGARRLLPGVVVALAGLALAGQSWPAVLGLAAVGVALALAPRPRR